MEDENARAGVYSASLKKRYLLADESWKEDVIPEILDGHNVADFIAVDIMQRLEELEREEGLRMAADGDEDDEMEEAEHSRSPKYHQTSLQSVIHLLKKQQNSLKMKSKKDKRLNECHISRQIDPHS